MWIGAGEVSITRAAPAGARRRKRTSADGEVRDGSLRREKNAKDAARRGAVRLRRYALANELVLHVTLTWRIEPSDEGAAAHEVGLFIKRLKKSHGGSFPWVRVIERGGLRDRLHAHLLMPMSVQQHIRSWGHGFAQVDYLGADADVVRAAEYLAKTFEATAPGTHRYTCARGFEPEATVVEARTPKEALGQAEDLFGARPTEVQHVPTIPGVSVVRAIWRDADRPDSRASRRACMPRNVRSSLHVLRLSALFRAELA